MRPDLEKGIHEISLRMRLLRALQEESSHSEALSERDTMLLELLDERCRMTVSEIAAAYPEVSSSTVSTAITKLWRDRGLVSKTINPENQRVTVVELTKKGKTALELVKQQRSERFRMLFHAINVTDDEQEVLIRVLNSAVAFFDRHPALKNAGENRK